MTSDPSAFLVNVPALDPASVPGVPTSVRFLDPGVATPDDGVSRFTPAELPMDRRVAKAMLAQFAQLARESRSVADISAFAQGQYEDFHSGTSFAIRDELEAARQGKEREIALAKARSRAQTELCLAWALEESSRELDGLSKKLGGQWADFERTLGLDEEDLYEGEEPALAGARPDLVPGGPKVPMAVLLDAVLTFLPAGAGIYCADPALLADWEEYGAVFAPADASTLARFGLEGSFREARVPGRLLCRMKRSDPAKPWLDEPRVVVAPGGE